MNGFPKVLMAAQLLTVTSQLAAKLTFVDYGSMLGSIGQWSFMVDSTKV